MFGALSLGAFGDKEYHIMVRSMICDYIDAHRSRCKEFITREISTYLREMRKPKWWEGNIELVTFSKLSEFNISVFDLVTDLTPRYSYVYSRSSETLSLIYRNEEHYNLLMRKSKNSIDKGVTNLSKQDIKNRGVWKVIENTRKDGFVNEEEIATANKNMKLYLNIDWMMIIISQFILKKFSVMTKIKLRIKKEILGR